jgi:predicted Fe-S protein YdhL (DUF1289 family)
MVDAPVTHAPMIDAAPGSPCINICQLDAQGLCVGCRRTLDEIAEWSSASEARRREILRALALRTKNPRV